MFDRHALRPSGRTGRVEDIADVVLGQGDVERRVRIPGGLVGQVTRVYQFSSEMTRVTDRDFAVPVQIQRTGLRTVAFGDAARAGMELRYLASTVDIREGDRLVTSGLDKLYPAGLPVGVVASVERGASNELTRVRVEPTAAVQNDRMLVVLQVDTSNVPPAPSPDGEDPGRRRVARR